MKVLCISALAVALLLAASPTLAGSRAETKIRVKNCSSGPISVCIDGYPGKSSGQYNGSGAECINPGCSKSFPVCAGKHTVYVLDAVNPECEPTEICTYVKKGCTAQVEYRGESAKSVPEGSTQPQGQQESECEPDLKGKSDSKGGSSGGSWWKRKWN